MSTEGWVNYVVLKSTDTDFKVNPHRIYVINCSDCLNPLFTYQKNGKEVLTRCYEDCIIKKIGLVITTDDRLSCRLCGCVLSLPKTLYSKKCTEYTIFKSGHEVCHLCGTDEIVHGEKRNAFELII
jgi:hypothetical protein